MDGIIRFMNAAKVLSNVNIRPTPARTAILQYIARARRPVSIGEIKTARSIQKLSLDQATVYRIIHVFIQKHILKQIDFLEGKFRFELAGQAHHHHVICTHCGAVRDVHDCLKESAESDIEKNTGFSVDSHALEFFGVCHKCKSADL